MFRRLPKSASPGPSSRSAELPPSNIRPSRAWAALVLATPARITLIAAMCLLFWAAVPALWGWTPTTVSSDSMAPGIRTGDVVISIPVDASTVKAGQVLLVESPDHAGQLRLHRMVGVNEAGELITKGDANPTDDSTPVARAAVQGVAFLKVPFVGLPGFWAREGNFFALVVLAAGASGILALSGLDRGLFRRLGAGERTLALAGERREKFGRHAPAIVAAFAVVIVGGLAAATITTASHATFSRSTTNPAQSFSAAAAFDCLSATPTNSPLFYYRFNETTGTSAVDSSINDHTGTLHGGSTRVAGSCVASSSPALTLDGSTGYVSTPTLISSPDVFSEELWFKTTTVTGGKLIGFGTAQTGASSQFDRHVYMTDSGHLVFGVYVSGFYIATSPLAYNDGAWHHLVATLSGTGMKLYVDGAAVASNASVAVGETDSGYWRIGYDNLSGWPSAPTSYYFKGTIDDAAVYSTALTAAQISALHAAGR
jgi:signal peptidase I